MIKTHKFLSLFAITLVAALLLSLSGKATSVYALADPVQAVSPIYDTQIYQLQDYIEHGGLTSSQLDIFYTLAGFYVLGQAGSAGYRLVDPYANSDSVWDWLKSCGIEIYNTVIGLVPDTARMPITGDIYSTIPFKKASTFYVATLMGAAVKAATFSSYQDFKDEVTNSQSYYLPWNLDVQKGMNSIFGIYGGIYEWQFTDVPWNEAITVSWKQIDSKPNGYYVALNNMSANKVRFNPDYYWGSGYLDGDFFTTYTNIFLDTSTGYAKLVDDSGTEAPSMICNLLIASEDYRYQNPNPYNMGYRQYQFDASVPLVEAVRTMLNNSAFTSTYWYIFLTDFVDHIYAGTNWLNKHEIFNLNNLNLQSNSQEYYEAVPSETDYLIDIKGILNDILGEIDLTNIFLNNLIDINGVPVHDDDLIRITTNIYDLLEQTNPVMPVNLNDISDYTNNDYLDLVKQHGQNFGETIGEYVAFWHNSDPEIIYVIFGALILNLIGAFVGKWGHS